MTLARYHRKAATRSAGVRGLDGGVDGQQVSPARDRLDRAGDAGDLVERAADLAEATLDPLDRIDERRNARDRLTDRLARCLQRRMGRFRGRVRRLGSAVDLFVSLDHRLGAGAQALELRLLALELLGDVVEVAGGVVRVEADCAQLAAE